uniref:Secreted protein n=1 Tax=Angiostrongylus cantonensis TaxID=6313 RepID=A0A0K0CTK8_ANGCA
MLFLVNSKPLLSLWQVKSHFLLFFSSIRIMLTLTILSLLSILPSVLIALKCHQIATANLSSPPETQPTECIAGSLACLKLIDYTSKTFSKQCHQFNCTVSFLTENLSIYRNLCYISKNGCRTRPKTKPYSAIRAMSAISRREGDPASTISML